MVEGLAQEVGHLAVVGHEALAPHDAAILLALHLGAAHRLALPLARPGVAAGVALALMETLADFGTVQTVC